MPERTLPAGMTPRLLGSPAAAAYCGVTGETFEKHIRPHVPPIEIGARRVWDVKALDRWLDERSGLTAELRPNCECSGGAPAASSSTEAAKGEARC